MEAIKKFFNIEEKGSSIKTELLAGLTTFLAMAYILPVNATTLSATGMPFGGIFFATALAAIVATLVMGLYAKYPVALAPGMGVNAFFAFSLVEYGPATWEQALGAVLVSGILFLIISVTGLRKIIINSIPKDLKHAIGAGIGFFIAFIGLRNSGIIVIDTEIYLPQLGHLSQPHVYLTIIGLIIGFVLYVKGNKFSLIISMTVTAIIGYLLGLILGADSIDRFVDGSFVAGLPTIGKNTSGLGSITEIFGKAFSDLGFIFTSAGVMAVFTFLFIDFFDTAGTLVAVGQDAGLIDENGELVDGDKALLADSIGTVAGAIFGVSTTTSYIESSTGINQGGKTGLTAVTVAILFAFALIAYPIISVFNSSITAIALVMVGAMMIGQLKYIDWDNNVTVVSGFIAIIMMILTFSIAHGISFAFIFYTLIMLFSGKSIGKEKDQLSPVMLGTTIVLIIFYFVENSGIIA